MFKDMKVGVKKNKHAKEIKKNTQADMKQK